MPRWLDVVVAGVGGVIIAPLALVLALLVALTSEGPVLYRQQRMGVDGQPFTLLKFRTMRTGADQSGRLTLGDRDPRTTPVGRFLRRHKLDELPQLLNVLHGDMALVGPRPEVPEYRRVGDRDQDVVLAHRPGLTDPASLRFRHEAELLAAQRDPDRYYREVLLPAKLAMSAAYLRRRTLGSDLALIGATVLALLVGTEPEGQAWALVTAPERDR